MQCYACDLPAVAQCQRCGNHHCAEHGGALCAACSDPVAAAPSSAFYRMALVGMLGASVLALWLLLRPDSVPGQVSDRVQQPGVATPVSTPALTPDTGDGTPVATGILTPSPVAATVTAAPTPAPTAEPTAAPTAEPTAAPLPEYTVQEGDTWSSIAIAYGIDAVSLASFNGYSVDDILPLGITLVIPQ